MKEEFKKAYALARKYVFWDYSFEDIEKEINDNNFPFWAVDYNGFYKDSCIRIYFVSDVIRYTLQACKNINNTYIKLIDCYTCKSATLRDFDIIPLNELIEYLYEENEI